MQLLDSKMTAQLHKTKLERCSVAALTTMCGCVEHCNRLISTVLSSNAGKQMSCLGSLVLASKLICRTVPKYEIDRQTVRQAE